MSAPTPSLLTFLDAPVVVGDPQGNAAYLNPAFEAAFGVTEGEVRGFPLAQIFEGGAREAVLRAVVEVCERGQSCRFRARQAGSGYAVVASPITAREARVGVVLLFTAAPAADELLASVQRELRDPLDEIARAFDCLLEQTGGRRGGRYRVALEDGHRALQRIQKWSEALGSPRADSGEAFRTDARCDPSPVLRRAQAKLSEPCRAAGVALEVLFPAQLPEVVGDARHLELALVRLVEALVAAGGRRRVLTLSSRSLERAGAVLVSVVDAPGPWSSVSSKPDPGALDEVSALAELLGGELVSIADPDLGTAHAIRIERADARRD